MIQGVRQVGEVVFHGVSGAPREILKALVEDLPRPQKRDAKPLMAVLDLRPGEERIAADLLELDPLKAEDYLWLGSACSNCDQDRATTKDLAYLLSQTIPNLARSADAPTALREFVRRLWPEYFRTLPGNKKDRRYLSLLNLDRFGIEVDWDSLEKEPPKKRPSVLAKHLASRLNLPVQEIALYTLAVGGEPLAHHPAYQQYLYRSLIERFFEKGSKGVCHLCGAHSQVTAELVRLKIKTFITQKKNFAAGIHESGFLRNYTVCRDCYVHLLLGERFVEQHFSLRVLRTLTYVIPELERTAGLSAKVLERLAERIRRQVGGLSQLQEVPKLLETFTERQGYTQLTLLFARREQAGLKVLELVPEVPPARIAKLVRAAVVADEWAREKWGDSVGFRGLEDLLWFTPVRWSGNEAHPRPALGVFRATLLGEPVARGRLLRGMLQVSRALFYGKQSFYATRGCPSNCPELHTYILRTLGFLRFMQEIGLWKGGNQMAQGDQMAQEVPEPYGSFVRELGFDSAEEGLFLLGVLLARVASEQYKASKSKPVLEKLNYQGMPFGRVRRFAVEIFDKLRQYRRLNGSEGVYASAIALLEREGNRWPLSDQENVYYILAGYAYETQRIIDAAKSGKEVQSNG